MGDDDDSLSTGSSSSDPLYFPSEFSWGWDLEEGWVMQLAAQPLPPADGHESAGRGEVALPQASSTSDGEFAADFAHPLTVRFRNHFAVRTGRSAQLLIYLPWSTSLVVVQVQPLLTIREVLDFVRSLIGRHVQAECEGEDIPPDFVAPTISHVDGPFHVRVSASAIVPRAAAVIDDDSPMKISIGDQRAWREGWPFPYDKVQVCSGAFLYLCRKTFGPPPCVWPCGDWYAATETVVIVPEGEYYVAYTCVPDHSKNLVGFRQRVFRSTDPITQVGWHKWQINMNARKEGTSQDEEQWSSTMSCQTKHE